MRLGGRTEKRISKAIPLYLVSLKDPRTAERVLTRDVSPHGARVLTKLRWQSGETQRIVSLSGQSQFSARVVYCRPGGGKYFSVGLQFQEAPVNWGEASLAAPSGANYAQPVAPVSVSLIRLVQRIVAGEG
jgi:hypothetical protein